MPDLLWWQWVLIALTYGVLSPVSDHYLNAKQRQKPPGWYDNE